MTYLWGGMILLGIIYGTLTGNLQSVTEAVVSSSKEAIALCVSMAGITAMWTGIMKIAENTGLVEQLSRGMRPVLRLLFPQLEPQSKACRYISLNFLSNDYFIIGLNKEPLTKRLYLVLFFVRGTALTHQQIFYIWVISSTARLSGRTLPYNKSIAEKQSL